MKTTPNDTLISVSEAAVMARMSRERILRRIQDGTLLGEMIAGRWFVRCESLQQLLARQSPLPPAA